MRGCEGQRISKWRSRREGCRWGACSAKFVQLERVGRASRAGWKTRRLGGRKAWKFIFELYKSKESKESRLRSFHLRVVSGRDFFWNAFFWSRKRAELRKFASYAFHVFEIQCNERWCDSQGDEVNASRENSLTGSGAKQTQTMHPVVNVASRASITTIACDRTNYFVSTGCIIPSGIRVYTNNVSESVLVSFFSGQEWMTLSGDRFRWFNYSNKSLCTCVPKVVGKYGKGNGKGRIFKNFRNSFFLSFFFHLLSPFDDLLFLKRRNFRHRFRFIRGAVSRTGAKRNVEEDGEKVK